VNGPQHDSPGGLFAGVWVGVVTNNQDPEGLGRVKVSFPGLDFADESAWARVATPMAGPGCGLYFLPEVDDEVLVLFEHGDLRRPYVMGALWNGRDKPPADNADGGNPVRLIRSRSGHVIRLDDTPGHERVEIADAHGDNRIVIDTAAGRIEITAAQDIVLKAPQGEIRLEARAVSVKAQTQLGAESDGDMTLRADKAVVVQGRTVDIN